MAVKAAQVGPGLAWSVFRHGMGACALSLASLPVMQAAAQSDPSALTDEGLRRQDERRQAQQRELQSRTDLLQAQPPRLRRRPLEPEQPCFSIQRIELTGERIKRLGWLREQFGPYTEGCLGVLGLQALVDDLNTELIEQGYVTSRISLPHQNLGAGTLRLHLHAGRIEAVTMQTVDAQGQVLPAADPRAERGTWRNSFPVAADELLNVRDLEQGVEQMNRIAGQSAATELLPGAAPDTSLLMIRRRALSTAERVRGGFSLDNSGSESLGRAQLSAFLTVDDLLGLSDILSLSLNSNAENPGAQQHSQSASWSYRIPLGFSTLSFSQSRSRFAQRVALTTTSVLSRGDSETNALRWEHVAWRTASSKTTLHAELSTRDSRSYLDDLELLVQRRKTRFLETGLSFRRAFTGNASLEASLAYKRGVRWLNAQDDFPVDAGGLTLRPKLWQLNLGFSTPFVLDPVNGGRPLQFSTQLRAQRTQDITLSADQIAIGGRGSVRGFDGDQVLIAENGWTIRNELSVGIKGWGIAWTPYLAIDAGRVWGPSGTALLGHRLLGAALGLRGQRQSLQFDLTLGSALSKPPGFKTASLAPYLSISYAL